MNLRCEAMGSVAWRRIAYIERLSAYDMKNATESMSEVGTSSVHALRYGTTMSKWLSSWMIYRAIDRHFFATSKKFNSQPFRRMLSSWWSRFTCAAAKSCSEFWQIQSRNWRRTQNDSWRLSIAISSFCWHLNEWLRVSLRGLNSEHIIGAGMIALNV